MDSWALLIPDYFPPSLNSAASGFGQHWSKRRKPKLDAIDRVRIYAMAAGGAPRFSGPVEVGVRRLYQGRRRPMDTENLYGAAKPLIDALRKPKKAYRGTEGGLGIIDDDDPGSLDLHCDQARLSDPQTIEWLEAHSLDVTEALRWQINTAIVIEGERAR